MGIGTWAHAPRGRDSAAKRQTIGVAIDRLTPDYQRFLFEAIAHEAREQGVNVVAISQGSSERNISIVVAAGDRMRALGAAHDAFNLGRDGTAGASSSSG